MLLTFIPAQKYFLQYEKEVCEYFVGWFGCLAK